MRGSQDRQGFLWRGPTSAPKHVALPAGQTPHGQARSERRPLAGCVRVLLCTRRRPGPRVLSLSSQMRRWKPGRLSSLAETCSWPEPAQQSPRSRCAGFGNVFLGSRPSERSFSPACTWEPG